MSGIRIALGSLLCGVVLCGAATAHHGAINFESTFSGPTGDSDASYRDHPDLVMAACSSAREFGGDPSACVWTTQVIGFAIKH